MLLLYTVLIKYKNWVAPTFWKRGNPSFLASQDPDGWSGFYPVAYWDKRWKDIWVGPNSIISELTKLGFDGVYLDWVEAHAAYPGLCVKAGR